MASKNQDIQVRLFGSLLKQPGKSRDPKTLVELKKPLPLAEVIKNLDIPLSRVQLVMVNHRAVSPDFLIHPGDRVSLFPREYAFFADWKAFRFSL